MEPSWKNCKNILVVRLDNMGDLLMTTPAIRALKQSFDCRITVLTSSMAAGIATHIPEIDFVITYDVPWVKSDHAVFSDSFWQITRVLKKRNFDAAVVFTVFSQNPMPAILLAYLAEIPKRLAYCRENPYHLLTDWVPDPEPYTLIKHQVERDLDLVKTVGATTNDEFLSLKIPPANDELSGKLAQNNIDLKQPFLLLHPGVSETKRQYPIAKWIELGQQLHQKFNYNLLITGSSAEKELAENLADGIGKTAFSLAGKLDFAELICLIKKAPLLIAVNTGPVHIAAAAQTPIVVLYAQTNPQHTPWKTPNKVLYFKVPEELKSKNEILKYVDRLAPEAPGFIAVEDIIAAASSFL